jgi:UDP-GlcNAc:undecaprenyl-phosphate GlcNAc-1-phosphate transferase
MGVLVPAVFMRMLMPSLERGVPVVNYRGRTVCAGLGVVWLVWAGCAIVGGVAASFVGRASVLPVLTLLGPLALVAFSLGVVDDAYGNGDDRGFRGHFRALARGRLTTGMLKLVGMGVAAVVVSLVLVQMAPWGGGEDAGWMRIPGVLLAASAIALTTNFVNLTDLRPGRALKAYTVLVLVGAALVPIALARAGVVEIAGGALLGIESLTLLIALLGPVFAVWHYDLGERAMLGDSGANAMGAVAGALIVIGLSFSGLVVFTLVLACLNAVSERVSYSAVIDRTPVLRWLDGLGRSTDHSPDEPASTVAEHVSRR